MIVLVTHICVTRPQWVNFQYPGVKFWLRYFDTTSRIWSCNHYAHDNLNVPYSNSLYNGKLSSFFSQIHGLPIKVCIRSLLWPNNRIYIYIYICVCMCVCILHLSLLPYIRAFVPLTFVALWRGSTLQQEWQIYPDVNKITSGPGGKKY